MHETELNAQQEFIKKWALKKMRKLEKKLKRYARIYFGKPMAIVYCQTGAIVVHRDGSESTISASEE